MVRAVIPSSGRGHQKSLRRLRCDGNAVGVIVEPLFAVKAVQRDAAPLYTDVGAGILLWYYAHDDHGGAQNLADVSQIDGFGKPGDVLSLRGESAEVSRAITGNDEKQDCGQQEYSHRQAH